MRLVAMADITLTNQRRREQVDDEPRRAQITRRDGTDKVVLPFEEAQY